MRKLSFFIPFILGIMLVACGEKKAEQESIATGNNQLAEKIKAEEATLDMNKPQPQKMEALIQLYKRYADSLPKDPASPVYLMKAGDLYHAQGQHAMKCQMYRTIIDKFPDFKDMDMTMYLYASALDSDLDQRSEAKKYYQLYVEKFPKSIYAGEAQSRLTTIDSLSFRQLEERIIKNMGKKPQ